jgi:cation/acetate symporter
VSLQGTNYQYPLLFAGKTGMVVNPAVFEKDAESLATKPAGSGPFTVTSYTQNDHAEMKKNDNFYLADEIKVARISAFVIGGIAIALAIPGQSLNVAFLVALAFAVAASANLPALLFNLFWKRFNTRGVLWSIYGGLISSVGLVIFSPIVSGKGVDPTGKNLSLLPTSIDISWFPLENPGIVSIPLGFLLGYLGTITSKERSSEDRFAELEVRSLTGAGSEK